MILWPAMPVKKYMTDENRIKDLEKELAFLYKVASSLHSLELNELLEEIVKIAVDVTGGDSCLIYILDQKKNELTLRASKNPHSDLLRNIKMKLGEGITGWVAKEKRAVSISKGAVKDARFKYFRSLPEDKFEAFISVPIVEKAGVIGVINIQHEKKHEHSKTEINLLSAIGKLVAGAVQNAILVEESLNLKETLELRKLIEKAKGILMKKKGISEDKAYQNLQKASMNQRKSLKEISEAIILADKIVLDKN